MTRPFTILLLLAGCWLALAQMPPLPGVPVQGPKAKVQSLLTPKLAGMAGTKLVRTVRTAPKAQPGALVLVWQSYYKGYTNVETVADAKTGDILGMWHEQQRVPAEQESVTNRCTNTLEVYRVYTDFKH